MQEIVNGNPKLRKVVYSLYAVGGLVLGSIQVGYSAAELAQPVWLTVALAVFAYVGVAFGFAAQSKVATQPAPPAVRETVAPALDGEGHVPDVDTQEA